MVEESEEEESDEGRISERMSCEESAIFSQILHIFLIFDKITQPFHLIPANLEFTFHCDIPTALMKFCDQ